MLFWNDFSKCTIHYLHLDVFGEWIISVSIALCACIEKYWIRPDLEIHLLLKKTFDIIPKTYLSSMMRKVKKGEKGLDYSSARRCFPRLSLLKGGRVVVFAIWFRSVLFQTCFLLIGCFYRRKI
jgi:hypothetical protein